MWPCTRGLGEREDVERLTAESLAAVKFDYEGSMAETIVAFRYGQPKPTACGRRNRSTLDRTPERHALRGFRPQTDRLSAALADHGFADTQEKVVRYVLQCRPVFGRRASLIQVR